MIGNNVVDAISDTTLLMKIYLVGGAVRDQLLGRPIRERDWVVVGATPQAMEQLGFRAKDPCFPVYLHPETGEEYALARRESKSGSGYKGFKFDFSTHISLEEDLARRDLTINAIAQSKNGEIIDPHHGAHDVQSRRLRHITTAFVEDPLRVLRLLRFQAELAEFHFQISKQTEALARRMCANGELSTLSAGRIWRETARALASPAPGAFFDGLHRWGALTQLMPWLQAQADQDPSFSLEALNRASTQCKDPDLRFAALVLSSTLRRGTPTRLPANWPIPATARTLIQLGVDHPLPPTTDAQAIFDWLESVDAWRRTDRFAALLQVWLAVQPDSMTSLNCLRQCYEISRRVPAPAPHANPRQAVRMYRLQQIRRALQ